MNYYQAFMPSNHHGISVLCEVYPEQKPDGTIKVDGRGVADFYCVPNSEDASAGRPWKLKNVVFRLGLPVPGQGLERTIKQYPNHKEVPVHFIGSIAFYLKDELKEVLDGHGITLGNVLRRPIDGLIAYHSLAK